ncbi:MAG: SGNH/GDSL hydrolase family protein [Chthonomonas sp.]|nr:SGNH/GDSL hydrolase family protein [Chthonomonas sp.]
MRRIFVAVAVLVAAVSSQAQIKKVVIFGDSLSDVGNTNSVTFGFAPGSGYWSGRFSNGPVWIERFSTRFHLGSVVRSQANGWNYAFGGAKTGSGYVSLVIANCATQVSRYLSRTSPAATDLFVLWIGGNDYLDGATNWTTAINNIGSDITRLASAGARLILVPNLPPLGLIPRYVGGANQNAMTNLTTGHNAALAARIALLRSLYPATTMVLLDIEQKLKDIVMSPQAYGFTNVTSQAMGLSGINPDAYLFWDDVHPTRRAHELLGQLAGKALAEYMVRTSR